jgi:hypothetical protein
MQCIAEQSISIISMDTKIGTVIIIMNQLNMSNQSPSPVEHATFESERTWEGLYVQLARDYDKLVDLCKKNRTYSIVRDEVMRFYPTDQENKSYA